MSIKNLTPTALAYKEHWKCKNISNVFNLTISKQMILQNRLRSLLSNLSFIDRQKEMFKNNPVCYGLL